MKIWRVENKQHIGPYTARVLQEAPKHLTKGPDAILDPYWNSEENNLFGFQTLQQLKNQFSRTDLRRLRKQGFNVVRLDVSAIATSDRYCFVARRNIIRRCLTLGFNTKEVQ